MHHDKVYSRNTLWLLLKELLIHQLILNIREKASDHLHDAKKAFVKTSVGTVKTVKIKYTLQHNGQPAEILSFINLF